MSSNSDDVATCPICMENFDEFTRQPKVLPCDHTFCLICLQSVVKARNLECPFCREKYDLGKYGPKSLLNNIHVLNLIHEKYSRGKGLVDSVQSIELSAPDNYEGSRQVWCLSCESSVTPRCAKNNHRMKNLTEVIEFRKARLGITLIKCQDLWTDILRNKLDVRKTLLAAEQAAQQMLGDIAINLRALDSHISQVQAEMHGVESLEVEELENLDLRDTLALYENKLVRGKDEQEKAQREADELKRLEGHSMKTTLVAPDGTTKELPQWCLALKADRPNRNSYLLPLLTYTLGKLTEHPQATQSNTPAACPVLNVAQNPSESERSITTTEIETSSAPASDLQEGQTWVGARPKTLLPRLEKARLEVQAKAKKPTINPPPASKEPEARPLAPCKAPQLPRLACAFVLAVNGSPRGRVVFDLRPDVAPIMCQKVAAMVMGKGSHSNKGEPTNYRGARILPRIAPEAVCCFWPEAECDRFRADTSTLHDERGSVRLRMKGKCDTPAGSQLWNVLVDCEWIICLKDPDVGQKVHRFTTVFAHVTEGLDLLDNIKGILEKGPMGGIVTVQDCYMI